MGHKKSYTEVVIRRYQWCYIPNLAINIKRCGQGTIYGPFPYWAINSRHSKNYSMTIICVVKLCHYRNGSCDYPNSNLNWNFFPSFGRYCNKSYLGVRPEPKCASWEFSEELRYWVFCFVLYSSDVYERYRLRQVSISKVPAINIRKFPVLVTHHVVHHFWVLHSHSYRIVT